MLALLLLLEAMLILALKSGRGFISLISGLFSGECL